MTHDPLREQIAQQFRFAMQLGSCDPSACPLCDCNMDDEGRAQIASIANQQADLVIARVREDERKYRNEVEYKYQLCVDEAQTVYVAALRDAVEAVKALPFAHMGWMCVEERNQAVAAIQALGGER